MRPYESASQSILNLGGDIPAHTSKHKLEAYRITGLDSSVKLRTILLVSKDLNSRVLIRNTLFSRGYLVLEAADQEHAAYVSKLMNGDIDLVIVDAKQAQFKGGPEWLLRNSPILVLVDHAATPYNMDELSTEVEYLVGPLSPETIAHKVKTVIESQD